MPVNQRVYYPVHAVGFAPLGSVVTTGTNNYRAAKGVQSVGLTTNFALEQVYQLGQLSLYENIENLPEIEVTAEKVIDGYSLLQHLATPTAIAAGLAGRYNDNRSMMLIAFYPFTQESATGTPLTYLELSGLYVGGINWNIPVEGNATESVTLTCRDKRWHFAPSGQPFATGGVFIGGPFTGNESPILASGGVQRRENVVMGSGNSIWPKDIPGIDQINGFNPSGSTGFESHIQTVTVGITLGREDLLELGRRGPYFRYATFPIEVTSSVEVTASESGDAKNAFQDQENLTDQSMVIKFTNGISINLGTKNKLTSISLAGGDTGGGNKTATYNYSNFNDYTCRFTAGDPAGQ
jgi:hypothetical protein